MNSDPEGQGWFFKIRLDNPGELDGLMDAAEYRPGEAMARAGYGALEPACGPLGNTAAVAECTI